MYISTCVQVDVDKMIDLMSVPDLEELVQKANRKIMLRKTATMSDNDIIKMYTQEGRTNAVRKFRDSSGMGLLDSMNHVDKVIAAELARK